MLKFWLKIVCVHVFLISKVSGFFFFLGYVAATQGNIYSMSKSKNRKWVYFGSSVVQQMCCLSVSFSDCGTCYQLNMGVVIGIITCDIILTLLITISVYCFVSREKRKNSLHACKNSSETGMCLFVCLFERKRLGCKHKWTCYFVLS